jgi:hypothetical protein
MIEKILRKRAKTFRYGTVISYSAGECKAVVQIGETTVIIKTTLNLKTGDTVVLARNDQDYSWLLIELSSNAMPSQTTLILI